MAKIEFPSLLKQLLGESDLQAPVRALADQIGNILSDNKLPFFPDYTDHGIDHVNRVMQFEVELVPKTVWEKSQNDSNPRLLCDADAAVIISATLLHDIAMHLREDGFRELVSADSRFRPLHWFKDAHDGHVADRLWHELWEEYVREAKRFSERDLAKIIGEKEARAWKFDQLPDEIGQRVGNHYRIIGEFIRRHHARLAHEIAIYGFPGLPVGSGEHQFPAMGTEKGHLLGRLADLIGLTARSHGMNLRTCQSYLDRKYAGTPRPMGTAVLYPMALLRVADYFQIDRLRAPSVLLQLRNPQSPVSVQEWKKHLAVLHIGPATDPRGKMVTVSTDICLSLYLQLQELLKEMQAEMDHSTAVLDEAYGPRNDLGLDQLNLAFRRVYSNLHDTAFRDKLPYVPERTGFRVDPNLLTLLVEPLYGKNPGVGVRELMQNAVDAVCEREAWSKAHGVALESLDLPEQEGDVLIEFIERENGTWFLRVRDKGIGMTSDTIKNYFLRAGASFRNSDEWMKEFVDDDGKPLVARAGRFGIGVFTVFLLGHSFRLWTRHAGTNKSEGYIIDASVDNQLIEIQRVDDLLIGTTVEVEISSETAINLGCEETSVKADVTDWFCWNWPKVVRHVVRNSKTMWLNQRYVLPIESQDAADWFVLPLAGFDEVYWTFGFAPPLSCNGIVILEPQSLLFRSRRDRGGLSWQKPLFEWPEKDISLKVPCVAIKDKTAQLPLTIQRYELSQQTLSFIDKLTRDVILSFIAHALVCGPTSCGDAISNIKRHPLSQKLEIPDVLIEPSFPYTSNLDSFFFSEGLLRCCATSCVFVPADPWLYSLLKTEKCLVYGVISIHELINISADSVFINKELGDFSKTACTNWSCLIKIFDDEDMNMAEQLVPTWFNNFPRCGFSALGHEVQASNVLLSSSYELDLRKQNGVFWNKKDAVTGRYRFEGNTSDIEQTFPLQPLMEKIEAQCDAIANVPFIFIAEFHTKQVERKPESLIAKVWHECLGARAIPFDPVAREALIADGCKHPELKRHIEAWQEMKRTGSKWVTGE